MGYTPAFDTIYTGTLYGRWPAAPVWASLLPLLSRHGEIDMSVEAICGMTGWPRELLLEGIGQLMEPDPHSRTPGHNGVRLEPLVEGRSWGWRAVNHSVYREKARKMNYDASRTESGRDADRKKQERSGRPEIDLIITRDGCRCGICCEPVDRQEVHVDHILPVSKGGSNEIGNLQLAHGRCNNGKSGGGTYLPNRHPSMPTIVPRTPALSRAVPLSDSDLNTDSEKNKIKTPVANATPPEGVEGLDSVAWSQWVAYRTSIRKPVKPASIPAAQRKLAAHGTSQAAVVEHSIANGYTGLYASKDQPPQHNGGQKLEKIYPGYKF